MRTEDQGHRDGSPRSDALTRADARPLRLEIDHRAVTVPEGTSVLRAAELAGVYVPSLCSHKELSPFGGCRLCTVEIAGMRGYPLACSTTVDEGMQVTTDTVALREMRSEIVQLILSEHPFSCLVCDEKVECARNQTTIRKAGVSTGCRNCPKDGECELQAVAERIGVVDVGYPVRYRGLDVEHDDPFFDRDYNLCILCGRCVRMCAEVRGTSVLSFKYRGPATVIGPAFGFSHVEAGCEFCGSCVSVCPTGALADKVSKWDGKPDAAMASTCPFCSLGCQVELACKNGSLSAARGALDPEVNDGQLCVRGRFCLPEATHHPSRARKPMLRKGRYFRVATWDEALDEVGGLLAGVAPADFHMLVSGDLSNEGMFAARRFAHSALGSNGLDSTARVTLPGGPDLWRRLLALPISLRSLAEADMVIAAGLDTRFAFSVAGVQVRRALRRGARLIAIDARESNLARMADEWVRTRPAEEALVLDRLVRRLLADGAEDPRRLAVGGKPDAEAAMVATAARLAAGGRRLAVVIGPRVFAGAGAADLVRDLEALAADDGVTVLPLAPGANIRGAFELGVLAGEPPVVRRPRVLYLVGEAPLAHRPDYDVVIAQDLYLPPFDVDAFLPAASFAEAAGTLTNIEGRVQELEAVEEPGSGAAVGSVRPDWKIFSDLAARLGRADLVYADAAAVRVAIRREVEDFPAEHDRSARRLPPLAPGERQKWRGRAERRKGDTSEALAGSGRFVLVPEPAAFRHRGFDLADVVEGLAELRLEAGLRLNPDDLARLGVQPGEVVTVSLETAGGGRVARVLEARLDPDCPRGAAYVSQPAADLPLARPVRVRISAGDRSRAKARPRQRRGCRMFPVIEQRMIVPNVHLLTVEAPDVAETAQPGNFVILRPSEEGERIPLTIADWDAAAGTVTSIFVQVGASTARLARLKAGDRIPSYAGPLGNATEIRRFGTVLLIAGCYGMGSVFPIAGALTEAGNRVIILVEARSSYLLYWEDRLRTVAERLIVVTRDGSRGYKGHVTRLAEILHDEGVSPDRVIAHGCTYQMMEVSRQTRPMGLKTIVSMNPIMIDGTGMCGVCRLTVAGETKFACVDGPEFDGHEVDWDEFLSRREGYGPEEIEPLRHSGCASRF